MIVSAVHEIGDKHVDDEQVKEAWDALRPDLDSFTEEEDRDYYDEYQRWHYCQGTWKSRVALDEFDVMISYHCKSKRYVVEIQIADLINGGGIANLEQILKEINDAFDLHFTLHAYYWYDGVDRTGGLRDE